jgi:hypothetical protein
MQTVKSIFTISLLTKDTIDKEKIFKQIDSFIPRDTSSTWDNGTKLQTWRRGDNCEVFINTSGVEVTEIMFRFDLADIDEKFRVDLIEFALSNKFELEIKQHLLFDPRKLTRELIEQNKGLFIELDDPLTFLKKQRV